MSSVVKRQLIATNSGVKLAKFKFVLIYDKWRLYICLIIILKDGNLVFYNTVFW